MHILKGRLRRLLGTLLLVVVRLPHARALGQRVLAPFPRVRALIIRLLHGGNPGRIAPANAVDGRGECQQGLIDALTHRWDRSA